MKNNNIKKWAALLGVIAGMAAAPLTVSALNVTSGTTYEPGPQTYNSISNQAALQVGGSLTYYSGTNLTLSATFDTSNGRRGAQVTSRARVSLSGGTVTATGSNGHAVYVDASTVALDHVNLRAEGTSGYGVYMINSSTLTMNGGTIAVTGSNGYGVGASNTSVVSLGNAAISAAGGHAVSISGTSSFTGTNLVINTSGNGASGLYLANDSQGQADGLQVTISGVNGNGIMLTNSAVFTGSNIIIHSSGSIGWGLRVVNGSTATIKDLDINLTGDRGGGIIIGSSRVTGPFQSSVLDITNLKIQTSGSDSSGMAISGNGPREVLVTNGDIRTTGADAAGLHVVGAVDTWGQGVFDNVSINAEQGYGIAVDPDFNAIVNISGSVTTAEFDLIFKNGSQVTGGAGALNVTTVASGTDNLGNWREVEVPTNVNVQLDDSGLTGGITGNDNSQITVTGSNGSTITGDVTGSGSSTIDVTVSGPGSSIIGDITQGGDSGITIEIKDGATGSGSWDNGNLVVGPGSGWDFTDDSHINNGRNDGTWNVGDHTVTVDDLTNNGTINIHVDTDTGDHGGLNVTGSAGGSGNIHVDTDGDGKLNPNDILPDLVTGNGTEDWTWDPIDWGLGELTVGRDGDGNLVITPSGKSSTVGALASGLIAAQKGAWFSQQNSLLKRMGDLRLNAETQRTTISGKEDKEVAAPVLTADALISNIWIRSYGAQYNYSADLTGRSFKQYVYGVDVGTDHRWTLDANNDLYIGAFVGYGAADTDHRYNGSESNLNNYYAGLYASWLNFDGWYADATIKAQYSDHELKGYHGGIDYFNAKYNNWSVGGSVELGKRFDLHKGWFIEPQLQANYLHIFADDYSVSTGQHLNVSELDALQLRFGVVAGKTLKLKNGGALQPYFKVSGVETVSSGGDIKSGYQSQRPNLDGARAELGAGIIWQLDQHNQLHLDYEASFGDKYDKPWGLTAGYRYQF